MRERTLKIALAASLAGNLFLGGLIVGTQLLDQGRSRAGPQRHPDRLAAASERLDPADAQALSELMRRKGEQVEPRVEALRAARRDVEAGLGRADYDREAVRAALERVRAEEVALRNDLDGTLLAFAERLEPDERAAIAPLFRKSGRGWRDPSRRERR